MATKIFSSVVRRIGIDLGSQTVRFWTDTDGIVLEQPCILAVERSTKKVLAVGDDALAMVGRVGEGVVLTRPVVAGRITDLKAAEVLLKAFLQQLVTRLALISPVMMVSVPAQSSTADRLVATRLLYNLGARQVFTISQPLAASIGAGVPIADASGCFLLHLGAGVVESVVVSLGSVVGRQASQYAGSYLERRLQYALKKEYSLSISTRIARKLLQELVTLNKQERSIAITGKDLKTARPKEVMVENTVLQPEVFAVVERYEQLLKELLSDVQPELTVDVIDKGLLLSGGLATIDGFAEYLTNNMGIPVSVVDTPDQAVIAGIGTALEHLELFKESLAYQYAVEQ